MTTTARPAGAAGPASAALLARAKQVFPSGVTHDNRYAPAGPVYFDHAQGTRKWDVDGHEYVDYWMGHGALLLGHCHPAVVEARSPSRPRGHALGAQHELEVRWGELVQQLVPVRRAGALHGVRHRGRRMWPLRLARAFTGKNKVVKFQGHFHGWHDSHDRRLSTPPYDVPLVGRACRAAIARHAAWSCPPNDLDRGRDACWQRDADIACGDPGADRRPATARSRSPTASSRAARAHHAARRAADLRRGHHRLPLRAGRRPGSYGRHARPDHAGQDPGRRAAGRRGGRAAPTSWPPWSSATTRAGTAISRMHHPGTFNANPLSAAAGVAMLEQIADGRAQPT